MIEQDNVLSYAATFSVVAVLAAAWMCKDAIAASVTIPESAAAWMRSRWLRLRGMQEYEGRHRYDYSNTVTA